MNAPAGPRWDTQVIGAFASLGERDGAEHRPAPAPNVAALDAAEHWLRQGFPVVVPTETVYGLAARADDRAAVERIYAIKGRPADNPLIVHISGLEQLALVQAIATPLAAAFSRQFWPGPLTLVLHTAAPRPWLSAGLDSIALRLPEHAFMRALIERVGPLAAPSANLSGRPSPTLAAHALADLAGQVPLIVDGGALDYGLESTVVDARGTAPILLRPGAIGVEELEACAGVALGSAEHANAPRSPGMKYRHYSPRAELWLYPVFDTDGTASVRELIAHDVAACSARGRRVATIASQAHAGAAHSIVMPADARAIGQRLFGWLRECDEHAVHLILVEGIAPHGIGHAVMDRLARAAHLVREPVAFELAQRQPSQSPEGRTNQR